LKYLDILLTSCYELVKEFVLGRGEQAAKGPLLQRRIEVPRKKRTLFLRLFVVPAPESQMIINGKRIRP